MAPSYANIFMADLDTTDHAYGGDTSMTFLRSGNTASPHELLHIRTCKMSKEWLLHASLYFQCLIIIAVKYKKLLLLHSTMVTAKSSKKKNRRQVNEK